MAKTSVWNKKEWFGLALIAVAVTARLTTTFASPPSSELEEGIAKVTIKGRGEQAFEEHEFKYLCHGTLAEIHPHSWLADRRDVNDAIIREGDRLCIEKLHAEELAKIEASPTGCDENKGKDQNEIWKEYLSKTHKIRSNIGLVNIQIQHLTDLESLYMVKQPHLESTKEKRDSLTFLLTGMANHLASRKDLFASLSPDARILACQIAKDGPKSKCDRVRPSEDLDTYIRRSLLNTTVEKIHGNLEAMRKHVVEALGKELPTSCKLD